MIDGKAVVIMVELKTPKKLPNNTINNETLILLTHYNFDFPRNADPFNH